MSLRAAGCSLVLFSLTACGDSTPDPGSLPSVGPLQVGWIATLQTRQHGVRGRATITDPSTITFTDFFYDGGGLSNVRIYSGLRGDYRGGFAFGPQLAGQPKSGATLTATLPPGKTLTDLDGVSIWCVDASVSFGDAQFHAP
jgi:hypothetical protein